MRKGWAQQVGVGLGAAEPGVLGSGAALPFTSSYSSAVSILLLLFCKKGGSPVPTVGTLAGWSAQCCACPGHSECSHSGLRVLPTGPSTLGPASRPPPFAVQPPASTAPLPGSR